MESYYLVVVIYQLDGAVFSETALVLLTIEGP